MSLLYAQVRREAMAWRTEKGEHHPVVHSVRDAGFAGLVGMSRNRQEEYDDEYGRHDDDEDGFDEDLHDETRPEPTPEEEEHKDLHGEYPEEYQDRHDKAYGNALDERNQKAHREDTPDHEDDHLRRVGAALLRGDPPIEGYYFNADKKGFPEPKSEW